MRLFLTALALSLALMNMPQSQAQSQIDTSCIEPLYGLKDRGELIRFDTELRQALKNQDILQLSTLVNYPLHVNGPGNVTVQLMNPEALKAYFPKFFTTEFRARILQIPGKDIGCVGSKGIMYGNGDLWVQPISLEAGKVAYRLDTINLPQPVAPQQNSLDFICETPYHRIVIDTVHDKVRYRSWNKPHSLVSKPDMEVASGSFDIQGTGVCSYSLWRFPTGQTTFKVTEKPPCGSGDETVASRGSLEIEVNGKTVQTLLCQ